MKQDFEGNTNALHLLGIGVSPEGITILLVKLKGFFGGLRQFNAKFMGPFQNGDSVFSQVTREIMWPLFLRT